MARNRRTFTAKFKAKPPSERDLVEMRLIDEEYTRHPLHGSRRITDWLYNQGLRLPPF